MTSSICHPKVIFHIDIDYFYAQVEEVLNPELKNKAFGIQQGLNVVTCNYIAREFGIKKWVSVKECLEKCPDLVLVNGEDLSNYKKFSVKISDFINEALGPTERMGLDEHTVDITRLVEDRLADMNEEELKNVEFSGPYYPSEESFNECDCGCDKRLIIGSQIAKEMREKIFSELNITCSAGIAHNKLLAKLCGGLNKPNSQTTLAPLSAEQFMIDLKDLRKITGIGGKTAQRIIELGVTTIQELQECPIEKLKSFFTVETANRLKDVSMGIDTSEVKASGKPKTVGLEHSCVPTLSRTEAKEKFEVLLVRLVERITDDVRIPHSMRVTIRKYDSHKKVSVKETKHFQVSSSSFKIIHGKVQLNMGADDKIIKEVLKLYDSMMEKEKNPINLFGLCFCKFQEVAKGANSIESFLRKKDDHPPPAKKVKIDHNENLNSEHSAHGNQVESKIPQNVDPSVWNELPPEIQQELYRNWQASRPGSSKSTVESKTLLNKGSKTDSILRYVVKKQ